MTTTTYDTIGAGYASVRRPDPRLRAALEGALGDAATIISIGAGAGNYEPSPQCIAAIEPSRAMIRQRPSGAAPAVQAAAETIPFRDQCVDAAMALHTVHHWTELGRGLAEMRRIAGRVLVLTVDPDVAKDPWIVADYVPEMIAGHLSQLPLISTLIGHLPGVRVLPVPAPSDCTDGFLVAYWARPEAYLDPQVRRATSAWHQLPDGIANRAVERLKVELDDGAWDRRYGQLRNLSSLDVGLRLIVAE